MRQGMLKKPSALVARQLQVQMGRREILREVEFSCDPGLVGLLGKNGAGKTTLLKSLLMLCPHQSGQILLKPQEGEELDLAGLSRRERARHMAYVPQELPPAVHAAVLEFVVMGRTPYLGWLAVPKAADYQRAREALAGLQMEQLSERFLDQLSGGERKLAYLARARVQQAEWMLLDEPSASLDFERQHQFFRLLCDSLRAGGDGALVTIHDPLLAYQYCDQILILEEGRLTASLKKTDPAFEEQYGKELERLYGRRAVFADTSEGKTIVWRRD